VRTAYPHDLVEGAVIRVPSAPGYWKRPFGLEISHREPVSKATGAITLTGRVLAQDGTTTRARAPYRKIVIATWMEPVTLLRKAPPREYTAKIATLLRQVPDGEERTMADMTTRWAVVDADGAPLPGDGPVTGWVLVGNWEGRPGPWLAREFAEIAPEEQRLRRNPIDQCIDRVRQERGILRVERLAYDLSVWPHKSAQELRETAPGVKAWRDTYQCTRCGRALQFIDRAPWWADAESNDTECHGEVWVP
jgi:hypothetical protein